MQGQLMPVQFYEDTLVMIDQGNEPFVAMKPVVSNMGLVWAAQYVKIAEKFGAVVSEIETTGADGKQYGMICLPLRKLPAWLYSITPNKVKPELRDKIIRYQEECDDVLWSYWAKGTAASLVPVAGPPNVTQQIALSRHRIALIKELQRTRSRAIRATIEEEITQLSAKLSLSVPDLKNIGVEDPFEKDILADFWAALRHLDGKGVRYNHAIKSNLLAIRLDEIAQQLEAHGITIKLDSKMTNALKNSLSPKYTDHNKTVYSAIKRCGIKCWVFESTPSPMN
ncbi:phage antirepressor N-terminal domain-containing protein [Pseudomonas vancouverensis]|uniref:phage antirepressor N-terminal domain-containing protein n=1 Tax=Pseudomonas vancouverensis TaxID=95300 RepID=UPI003D009373